MAHIQISFDPADPEDVQRVMRVLQALSPDESRAPAATSFDLTKAVGSIVRGGVDGGEVRRRFLRAVAEAASSGGLRIEDSPYKNKALGGLVTSLARGWHGEGGTGDFIAWDRATGRYVMQPDVAAVVLAALDQVEAAKAAGSE